MIVVVRGAGAGFDGCGVTVAVTCTGCGRPFDEFKRLPSGALWIQILLAATVLQIDAEGAQWWTCRRHPGYVRCPLCCGR
jgi:hypothetical protein